MLDLDLFFTNKYHPAFQQWWKALNETDLWLKKTADQARTARDNLFHCLL